MKRKDSIEVVEPVWWENLMIFLNNRVNNHDFLMAIIPITADIFVFTYPLYLVVLYLRGIRKQNNYYKDASLWIFSSVVITVFINYVIQLFGDKSRPEQAIENKQNLILEHLPTDPFPSDHAAVSATIAMATLLRWIKHEDKFFIRLSYFFWFACFAMSFSRVAVAIHWPTDILVWILVWSLSAWLIFSNKNRISIQRYILRPIIKFEKWLFRLVFGIKQ